MTRDILDLFDFDWGTPRRYQVELNDGTITTIETYLDENGDGEVFEHIYFVDDKDEKYSIDDIKRLITKITDL